MKGIICIEGVVGAGKTTIGEILAKELGMKFFQEPYIKNPFLDRFYREKERYSFLSQMYFLSKRLDIMEEVRKKSGCIIDRGMSGDYLFAKMHFKSKYMSSDEFNLYNKFWNRVEELIEKPILTIYLEIGVAKAVERIKERGRDFELNVDIDYWKTLNEEYSKFLKKQNKKSVLRININDMDIKENKSDRDKFINLVKGRLKEIKEER